MVAGLGGSTDDDQIGPRSHRHPQELLGYVAVSVDERELDGVVRGIPTCLLPQMCGLLVLGLFNDPEGDA